MTLKSTSLATVFSPSFGPASPTAWWTFQMGYSKASQVQHVQTELVISAPKPSALPHFSIKGNNSFPISQVPPRIIWALSSIPPSLSLIPHLWSVVRCCCLYLYHISQVSSLLSIATDNHLHLKFMFSSSLSYIITTASYTGGTCARSCSLSQDLTNETLNKVTSWLWVSCKMRGLD